jgi:penicillin-binding protein A
VREHADGGPPSETVLERYSSPGSVGVISPQSAAQVRAAMIDAVNGQLGRSFAGAADIRLYGIGGAMSAGKTGTAQLGGERAPHAWFIGFAPGEEGATPSIAIAVLVEGGGSGGGRAAPIGGAVMAEWLRMSADIAS